MGNVWFSNFCNCDLRVWLSTLIALIVVMVVHCFIPIRAARDPVVTSSMVAGSVTMFFSDNHRSSACWVVGMIWLWNRDGTVCCSMSAKGWIPVLKSIVKTKNAKRRFMMIHQSMMKTFLGNVAWRRLSLSSLSAVSGASPLILTNPPNGMRLIV